MLAIINGYSNKSIGLIKSIKNIKIGLWIEGAS